MMTSKSLQGSGTSRCLQVPQAKRRIRRGWDQFPLGHKLHISHGFLVVLENGVGISRVAQVVHVDWMVYQRHNQLVRSDFYVTVHRSLGPLPTIKPLPAEPYAKIWRFWGLNWTQQTLALASRLLIECGVSVDQMYTFMSSEPEAKSFGSQWLKSTDQARFWCSCKTKHNSRTHLHH